MAYANHAASGSSQHINGKGNANGNGNTDDRFYTNSTHVHGSSQASGSNVTNGLAAAAELARSGATTTTTAAASSPPASQQSVDSNGHARPVFKNPLGVWRSPSPSAKRQKMTPGHRENSASAAATTKTTTKKTTSPGGGFRRGNSDIVAKVPPSQSWTPRTFSHSQPAPSASSTPTRGPARTPIPVSTPARSGSPGVLPVQRRVPVSVPVKVTETTENNRVVLVIVDDDDDDDDDDEDNHNNDKNRGPTPVPVPVVPAVVAARASPRQLVTPVPLPVQGRLPSPPLSSWAAASMPILAARSATLPHPPPVNNGSYIGGYHHDHVPPRHVQTGQVQGQAPSLQAPRTSNAEGTRPVAPRVTPIAPPQFFKHSAGFTTPQPANQPFSLTTVKPHPIEDSANRSSMRNIPQARPSTSQRSASPVTEVPVTPVRLATTTGPTTYGAPAPAPSSILPYVPSDVVNPVIHNNESRTTTRPIGEHLEPAVNVDITPTRPSTLALTPRRRTRQEQEQQHFVRYANLARRPYLRSSHRTFVSQNHHHLPSLLGLPRNQQRGLSTAGTATSPSVVIHVDFLPDEIQHLLDVVRFVHANTGVGKPSKRAPGQKHSSAERELKSLLRRQPPEFEQLVVNSTTAGRLPGRKQADINAFLVDARTGNINSNDGSNSNNKNRSGRSSTEALSPSLGGPAALTLKRHDRAAYSLQEAQAARATKLNTFVMMREVAGQRPVHGRLRQLLNFTNAVRTLREDGLRLRHEWTNLAGDVITVSWTSKDAFICGTTTHMDDRNHQYNRQGNLALASVSAGTLRAYPDHRIARAQVTTNSTTTPLQPRPDAYDDPWLYTSVVSSDYDATHDLAFTSGFDKTVRVWKVNKDGGAMVFQGKWDHEGKVNFVVASSSPDCLVATAADVPVLAVRVYRIPSVQERMRGKRQVLYKTLSCSRIVDREGSPVITDKWAYFPAAIRWGLSDTTRHLLLVGYSPRGLDINADDDDIPEDCRNSGELCLWDGLTGEPWRILGAMSQNVFEVAWHPTQACFAAATAPTMNAAIKDHVRTQIRIFRLSANSEYGGRAYSEVQTLDCYADDINELALRPNSFGFLYVAAGCTNGHTYVWDTSQGDNPIHDLGHGECIEELSGEKISTEDTGVKFVAWGETPDRLYTGSSDGLIKVWNIRTHGVSGLSPFVRNLLQCPAPVSFGTFSPDKSKLSIGDASGRVFLMSVEDGMEKDDEDGDFLSEEDEVVEEDTNAKLAPHLQRRGPGGANNLCCNLQRSHPAFKHHPPEIIRHATPPPPSPPRPTAEQQIQQQNPTATQPPATAPTTTADDEDEDENSGLVRSRAFVTSGQLVVVPDPTVGAVKGPNYADTKLFRLDFHQDRLPERPLLAQFDRLQQENRPRASTLPSRQRALHNVYPDVSPAAASFGSSSTSTLSVLGAPDPIQALQRKKAVRRVQMLHADNVACDLNVNSLPDETREALELADRAALLHFDDNDYDYGFDYEEVPADV